ncbi:MAG TPA: hypothetical protein VHV26_07480 [Rhizomicrobium sp.]|jgi:hypothetical protein|nr:hypothetical protein [Rhizomicrobium sp.]
MTGKPLPQLQATDSADSPVFDTFFESYSRAFILPDEMENRDGFAECLALNHGPAHAALVARYGPFRELCVTARDPMDDRLIGGANFIAMPQQSAGRRIVTANLNYVFVDEAARRQGRFRPLVASLHKLIGGLFASAADAVLIFIEQNDPLLLTPQAYARDSGFSGLDQFDRLRIWASLGALVLDFPYVQPALSAQQEPDRRLIYSILGTTGASLDACLLKWHLRNFFGISVLKGRELDAIAAQQLAALRQMSDTGREVALLDPGPAMAELDRGKEAELVRREHRPLRDWLKDQSASSMLR